MINLIKAHINLTEYTAALHKLEDLISNHPNDAEIAYLIGKTLHGLNRLQEASDQFLIAIKSNPNLIEAYSDYGNLLCDLKLYEEAITYYTHVLNIQPENYGVLLNKGTALNGLKKFEDALMCYDIIISKIPTFAEAWLNKGKTLHELKLYSEAILHNKEAIKFKPKLSDAWFNIGSSFLELDDFENAVLYFEKTLELNSDMQYILGDTLYAKMKLCDWTSFKKMQSSITSKIIEFKNIVRPFPLLYLIDNPELQLISNKNFILNESTKSTSNNKFINRNKNDRIRVAYLSPDFRNHPVSYLIAEVLESHDDAMFETYGIYFGPPTTDAMHTRINRAFHHYIDVSSLTESQICEKLIFLNIDIAIDLAGNTKYSRGDIFKERCAPIQVNYLGYPGTSGADYIDYIIADKTVIPKELVKYYCETPVFMPHCFQANDSKRKISDLPVSKEMFGLPNDKFIFCCFNSNHKFNPIIFDVWSRILKSSINSILWLFAESNKSKNNIIKEMIARGVKVDRLFFAEKLEYSKHLARYSLADLFLDTLPFNGGTTSSDALWAGLPVLTQTGNSFAGRMSTSLLKAIQVSELICNSEDEYIAKAIHFSSNPYLISSIKQSIAIRKKSSPIFDGVLFCRHLELAYKEMITKYYDGSKLEPIDVNQLL